MPIQGEHVEIDETAFGGLIEESRDTHADALRAAKDPLADMVDLGRQTRAGSGPGPDESRAFAVENRRRLGAIARRAGGLLAATGVIAAIADYIGSPAFASSGTDVQVLQTASSIEVLAVSAYKTALGLPYIGGSSANPVIKAFATTTASQHADHMAAFQSATTSLGGAKQVKPDPAFVPVVDRAVAAITRASDSQGALLIVGLALELENIAAETYVNNMSLLTDANAKKVTASIMGVEAQHVAILLAVQALLKAGDAAGGQTSRRRRVGRIPECLLPDDQRRPSQPGSPVMSATDPVSHLSEAELRAMTTELDAMHHDLTLPALKDSLAEWSDDIRSQGDVGHDSDAEQRLPSSTAAGS